MKYLFKQTLALFALLMTSAAFANEVVIQMHSVETGKPVGTITASDSQFGLLLSPNLTGLTPGIHGFHVHEKPSCAEGAIAAGAHLDPNKTEKHRGPYSKEGHVGDLPALTADKEGKATLPVLAPQLKVTDLGGHALIVHEGPDNYSDNPKLGGGGPRVACGVIE